MESLKDKFKYAFKGLKHIFNDSAVDTNYQSIPTFEKSNARIDYILVDKSLEIDKYYVDKIYLSDHFPIIVDIK